MDTGIKTQYPIAKMIGAISKDQTLVAGPILRKIYPIIITAIPTINSK